MNEINGNIHEIDSNSNNGNDLRNQNQFRSIPEPVEPVNVINQRRNSQHGHGYNVGARRVPSMNGHGRGMFQNASRMHASHSMHYEFNRQFGNNHHGNNNHGNNYGNNISGNNINGM